MASNLEINSLPKLINFKEACLEFFSKKGEIYVRIDDKDFHCPSHNILKIDGYFSEIKCASKKILCRRKYNCKFGCTSLR